MSIEVGGGVEQRESNRLVVAGRERIIWGGVSVCLINFLPQRAAIYQML